MKNMSVLWHDLPLYGDQISPKFSKRPYALSTRCPRCLWRTSGRYWEAGDNGECEKVYRDCLRASWLWRADLYTICGKWWKNCGACVQLWFKMASVARMLRLILILLARLAYLKFALSGKKRKWQIEAAKFFTLLLFSYLHINKWNIL